MLLSDNGWVHIAMRGSCVFCLDLSVGSEELPGVLLLSCYVVCLVLLDLAQRGLRLGLELGAGFLRFFSGTMFIWTDGWDWGIPDCLMEWMWE